MATEWKIDSDIYDILSSVQNVEKRYIDDESETTLALGIFGFVADTEAKKIQTATIMAGQLGNEMFPTRALLTKNVLTHAAYNGITDINATPANITITLCIKTSDIATYVDSNGYFYLDSLYPIYIGDYEFHFDYDIKIKRKAVGSKYTYSAQYITEDDNGIKIINRLSNIANPYLPQPFLINIGGEEHIGIQATIRQVSIEEIEDTMTSDSIIENKSYSFTFDNQMADFLLEVTDNDVVTRVTPYMYGSSPDNTDEAYCWYLYTDENTVRITFDSKSYIPGLSSKIYIKAFTTIGSSGNFDYLNIDQTSEGLYIIVESDKYQYKNLTCYLVAVTDSVDGVDRKSKTELQKLIPKAAMSRGSITTETDLTNYFNLINTDTNRMLLKKKVDNQLSRTWYSYYLLKDDLTNIIPTNTFDITVNINSTHVTQSSDGRYIIPANSCFKLDPSTNIATIIDEADVPDFIGDSAEYFDGSYYYYLNIYTLVLDTDPLYSSYYLTICNYDSYFVYNYINDQSDIQFIANRFSFTRNLKVEPDQYRMSFSIARSINDSSFTAVESENYEVVNEDGTKSVQTFTTDNLKVILVLYKDGVAYRWTEMDLEDTIEASSIYSFATSIVTTNEFNDKNIKINGMHKAGSSSILYGYVPATTEARIYILAKVASSASINNPRMDLDNIAPGYEDYIVTNIYDCVSGLDFFKNYTSIINNRITANETFSNLYTIYGVPCVGYHYIISDTEAKYLVEAINEKKDYIDYCLSLVENSMNIDFKFFNTYGPSRTYTLEDNETYIGNIDISLRFKVSLRPNIDSIILADIKKSIKDYIEDINDIGDFHVPNLITEITNTYSDRIYFIEFVGFNKFDADDQHIINIGTDENIDIAPEFINVRNIYNEESGDLEYAINIELV